MNSSIENRLKHSINLYYLGLTNIKDRKVLKLFMDFNYIILSEYIITKYYFHGYIA